ncbi:MAG: hypothetical protein ACXWQQ_04340 [Pseudobdellovibrio sp.]
MKLMSVVFIILSASLTSFAVGNPQIRACVASGGEFMTVNTDDDQLGMCRYSQALIGAIDILNKDEPSSTPLSIENYRDGVVDCDAFNVMTVKTFSGAVIQVCRFDDGSMMDIQTLSRGRYDYRNRLLNQALGF